MKQYFNLLDNNILSSSRETNSVLNKEIVSYVKKLCNLEVATAELNIVEELSVEISCQFTQAIIVGIGGAVACSRAIAKFKNFQSSKFKLIYSEAISRSELEIVFCKENLEKSAIFIISKSGESVETLSQANFIIERYYNIFGREYNLGRHLYFITSSDGQLKNMAVGLKANILNYSGKSGKFSQFTKEGLLPANLIGIGTKKILQGAEDYLADNFEDAVKAVLIHKAMIDKGIKTHILLSYDDRLNELLKLDCQINAEICAKEQKGCSTFYSTLENQHNLWQLYLDGPRDKYFSLIKISNSESNLEVFGKISETYFDLNQKRLLEKNIPFRVIELSEINEYIIGKITMKFLLEKILLAKFLSINPEEHNEINITKNFQYKKFIKT